MGTKSVVRIDNRIDRKRPLRALAIAHANATWKAYAGRTIRDRPLRPVGAPGYAQIAGIVAPSVT